MSRGRSWSQGAQPLSPHSISGDAHQPDGGATLQDSKAIVGPVTPLGESGTGRGVWAGRGWKQNWVLGASGKAFPLCALSSPSGQQVRSQPSGWQLGFWGTGGPRARTSIGSRAKPAGTEAAARGGGPHHQQGRWASRVPACPGAGCLWPGSGQLVFVGPPSSCDWAGQSQPSLPPDSLHPSLR